MRGLHSAQGVRSVVYLTEQQPSSFRASLARSGLLGRDALTIVFWHEAMALPWAAIAAVVGRQCRANGARLLVVDTLSQWAGMRGDTKNQAGDAFEALQPLQSIAGTGVAVVFLQHERKSGGDAADAGRGSSAFAGAVDTLVSFRSPPYYSPSRPLMVGQSNQGKGSGERSVLPSDRSALRLLLSLSRFEDVPPELYIECDGGTYAVVGRAPDFGAHQARAAILAALATPGTPTLGGKRPGVRSDSPSSEGLPSPLEGEGPGMRGHEEGAEDSSALTIEDLIQTAGAPRRPIITAIETLLAAGQISRTGAGRKGNPYRYRAQNSFPSAIEEGT